MAKVDDILIFPILFVLSHCSIILQKVFLLHCISRLGLGRDFDYGGRGLPSVFADKILQEMLLPVES